jgi:hypothetical protein
MSDRATLRRLLFIKEDSILRLFDATQREHDAQVAALQAALDAALKRAEAAEARAERLQAELG